MNDDKKEPFIEKLSNLRQLNDIQKLGLSFKEYYITNLLDRFEQERARKTPITSQSIVTGSVGSAITNSISNIGNFTTTI